MALPTISEHEVRVHFPHVEEIAEPIRGGQKLVFRCRIGDSSFVLKVMLSDAATDTSDTGDSKTDEVFERAKREVKILESCDCENLPKVGPIPLSRFEHAGQSLIAFAEEFIVGRNLNEILTDEGPLDDGQTIKLGEDLNTAVDALWGQRKIHRDIKPQNIMRRDDNGQFVLLDPGIAFDLHDMSLTASMAIAHTPGYLAPELSNPAKKRDADCRSDFFLIGIVLYLASTEKHPFIEKPSQGGSHVIHNIVTVDPQPTHEVRPEVSQNLSDLIMRLLAKRKHGRYRNSTMLRAALAECSGSLEQ